MAMPKYRKCLKNQSSSPTRIKKRIRSKIPTAQLKNKFIQLFNKGLVRLKRVNRKGKRRFVKTKARKGRKCTNGEYEVLEALGLMRVSYIDDETANIKSEDVKTNIAGDNKNFQVKICNNNDTEVENNNLECDQVKADKEADQPNTIWCRKCNLTFNVKSDYNTHRTKEHPRIQHVKCKICLKEFNNYKQLTAHKKRHEGM